MARFASESIAGFYATPLEEIQHVCRRLTVAGEGLINILDPCCGEGVALNQISEYLVQFHGTVLRSFGIELEKTRARKAKNCLNHVLQCGYEGFRMTNNAVTCLWLNPPYNERELQRTEVKFLRDLTAKDRLQDDALVMFCIPQEVLDYAANLLSVRLRDIRVYRFTDKNYDFCRQVVVFGYRKSGRAGKEAAEVKNWLQNMANAGPSALSPLDVEDDVTYTVPISSGPVVLFKPSELDPIELAQSVDCSPVWDKVEDILFPKSKRISAKLKNPVLPLKFTHYATAIAANAIGGNMNGHWLRGIPQQVVESSDHTDDEGREKMVEIKRTISTSRIYTPAGIFTYK